jgi:hypothetical protein
VTRAADTIAAAMPANVTRLSAAGKAWRVTRAAPWATANATTSTTSSPVATPSRAPTIQPTMAAPEATSASPAE